MAAPFRVPLIHGRPPTLVDHLLKIGETEPLQLYRWAGFRHGSVIGLLRLIAQGRSGAMANKGRTAIVTGAGKRVGLEIARELLTDGWAVVAHLHHDQDSVPDGAVKVVADLADPSCAEAIFAATA